LQARLDFDDFFTLYYYSLARQRRRCPIVGGNAIARRLMSDGGFQEAYARVRSRFTEEAWIALTPRQITDLIYREIRELDAERNRPAAGAKPAAAGGRAG
jgi:hypothetical protein